MTEEVGPELEARARQEAPQDLADCTPLSNGAEVTNISAITGGQKCYALEVTLGATQLKFDISGGTGDADLYVKQGYAPTTSNYTCRPYQSGNTETCTISNPAAGTWYACSYGYSTYTAVTMKGTYSPSY
jgi:hypothetical protein